MIVLIITGGFFPGKKYGGPPVSIDNFCSLMKDFDCYIVTTNHDLFDKAVYKNINEGWNDRGNCKVLYLSDKMFNKSQFEKIIINLHPDILYLQGIFQSCIFPCLSIAKKLDLKVLLAPRGELCDGAMLRNIKKYKKIPYIYCLKALGLFDKIFFQSTSDEETDSIKRWIVCNQEKIFLLNNIPSLPAKSYSIKTKISGEGRFIFLSRINPKKNLLGAIKFFSEIKGKAILHIYGPIEDNSYWDECKTEIKKAPDNVSIEYKGLVSHEYVHEVFSQYDAFLFPTFSENYGHVIAESLMVGTPVVVSDQTPWLDLEKYNSGWSIDLNDKKKFIRVLEHVISLSNQEMLMKRKDTKEYIENKLDIKRLLNSYNEVFSKICV